MIVKTSYQDLPAHDSPMRTLIAEPAMDGGKFPGILLYADIFAQTEPTVRAAVRFASYGFVVAVPEFYHRTEPAGTVIPFADRDHAMTAAGSTRKEHFDADARTTLDFLAKHPRVRTGAIGVTGFCIGGHLTVRTALQPDVRAGVAFYPTGMHENALGGSTDADTLAHVAKGEIKGKMLVIFGASDPHIPLDAITKIQDAFAKSGTSYKIAMYDGEHAFMRDEGPRWNPSETDRAFREATDFFHEVLGPIG
jgi:carboxymethylenebutenolidase